MNTLATLENNGIDYNAQALINAVRRTAVPLWVAAAFVEQESRGANIYGHDAGGAMSGAGEVTQSNFARFLSLIHAGHTSNGVGPLQITWAGFFTDAAEKGFHMWNPEDNMVYGLALIRSYLGGSSSDAAIVHAGLRYNGAEEYGYEVLAKAKRWRSLLGSATPSAGGFPLAEGEWYGVDDGTDASHSGVRSGDAANVEFIQRKVGVTADGSFGPLTEKAVKTWQAAHGLTADGEVGPLTWAAMHK